MCIVVPVMVWCCLRCGLWVCMRWASRVLAIACNALLWWLVHRLLMCLFVQHESRWRHVSFWRDVQRLLRGDVSGLRTCFLQQLPRYLPYRNLRTCVICVLVIQGASHHKWRSVVESHLRTYGGCVGYLWYKYTFVFLNVSFQVTMLGVLKASMKSIVR